jgi:hypothetical protein
MAPWGAIRSGVFGEQGLDGVVSTDHDAATEAELKPLD